MGVERLCPSDLGEPTVLVVGSTGRDIVLTTVEVVPVLPAHSDLHRYGVAVHTNVPMTPHLIPADRFLPVLRLGVVIFVYVRSLTGHGEIRVTRPDQFLGCRLCSDDLIVNTGSNARVIVVSFLVIKFFRLSGVLQ